KGRADADHLFDVVILIDRLLQVKDLRFQGRDPRPLLFEVMGAAVEFLDQLLQLGALADDPWQLLLEVFDLIVVARRVNGFIALAAERLADDAASRVAAPDALRLEIKDLA